MGAHLLCHPGDASFLNSRRSARSLLAPKAGGGGGGGVALPGCPTMAVPTKSGHGCRGLGSHHGGSESKTITVAHIGGVGDQCTTWCWCPWPVPRCLNRGGGDGAGTRGSAYSNQSEKLSQETTALGVGAVFPPHLKGCACQPLSRIPVQPKATTPTATRLMA